MSNIEFSSTDEAVSIAKEIWWQQVRLHHDKRPLGGPRRTLVCNCRTLKKCVQVPVTGWLEAINAHPRLGDKAAMEAKMEVSVSAIQKRIAAEQDTLLREQGEVVMEVSTWSKRYEAKFGHVFLLFAQGKKMTDVLESIKLRCAHALLLSIFQVLRCMHSVQQPRQARTALAACRYENTPVAELQCAAQQEAQIIEHRLRWLIQNKSGGASAGSSEVAAERTGVQLPALSTER